MLNVIFILQIDIDIVRVASMHRIDISINRYTHSIKLTAHLCSRPRAHVLIYRKVLCLCNEYKNVKTHTWVFFV